MVKVYNAAGSTQAETFLVNIRLPSDVAFGRLRVTKGELAGDADILIGMDIISQGDFAVTHPKGVTKFSFRIPSSADIDFYADLTKPASGPQFQHGGMLKPKRRKRTKPSGSRKGKRKKR